MRKTASILAIVAIMASVAAPCLVMADNPGSEPGTAAPKPMPVGTPLDGIIIANPANQSENGTAAPMPMPVGNPSDGIRVA